MKFRVIHLLAIVIVFGMHVKTVGAQIEYRITIVKGQDTTYSIFSKSSEFQPTNTFRIEKLSKRKLRSHSLRSEAKKKGRLAKVDHQLLSENVLLMERTTDTVVSLDNVYDYIYKNRWLNPDTSEIYIDVCFGRPPYYAIEKFQNGRQVWDYSFDNLFGEVPSIDRFTKWNELVQSGIGIETKDEYLKREFGDHPTQWLMLKYLKQCVNQ